MSAKELPGQPDKGPSLRDSISSAFDAVSSAPAASDVAPPMDDAPAPPPEVKGGEPAAPSAPAAAKPGQEPAKPADPAAATQAAEKAADGKPADGKPAKAKPDIPKTPPGFPGGDAAWNAATPEMRGWVKGREQQVEKYIRANAEASKFGGLMWNAVRPYEALLRQQGAHPAAVVQSLMNLHYTLSQGHPAEKVAALRALVNQYGVEAVDDGQPAAPAQPAVDHETRQRLQQIEQYLRAGVHQAELAHAHGVVSSFAADSQREFMNREDVRHAMADLLELGHAQSIEQAYDMAIWQRPDLRAVLMEKDAARRQTEARAAAGEAVPRGGAPIAAVMEPNDDSLRGSIERAMAAHTKRAA